MSAVTAFVKSLRADLLDRRMLPILLALVVALLAAVGYAAFGSAESVQAPAVATAPVVAPSPGAGTAGIAVSQVSKGATGPVSEVTSGVALQHGGPTRDPLAVPASAQPKKAKSAPASKVSGSSSAKPTVSPAPTPPASTPKPEAPKKPKVVHKVDLFFGIVPAGTTTAVSGLTPYGNLTNVTPLPSPTENLIELVAVSGTIKAARFKFIQPMIPTGVAKCIPSPTQCEAIDVKPGQFEDLEYAPPGGGPAVLYQLQLFSITNGGASAASVSAHPRP